MNEKNTKVQTTDKYSIFKGITILFVVSIHVLYKFHGHDKPGVLEAFNYIIGFSVPLFMILGGFFLTSRLENLKSLEDIKFYLIRVAKRILIPYYIFIIILTCFCYLTSKQLSILPFLLVDANTHGLYFIIIYIYSYIMSGLLTYFFIVVFKIKKNILLAIVLPLISLIFFPLSKIFIEYFPYSSVAGSLSYISYFIFGFPIAIFCRKISSLNTIKKFRWLFIVIVFSFFYTIFLYFARKIYGHFPIIASHPPTFFLLIYSICVFLILNILLDELNILTVIGKKLLLNKFGDESLFIFYIHPYFIYLLPFIFNAFFKDILHNNMFVFPWLVFSYLITFFSLKIYDILPLKYKTIFSR
jgi:hypothetical protein